MKVLAGVMVVSVAALMVGALGTTRLATLDRRMETIRTGNVQRIEDLSTARSGFMLMYHAMIAVRSLALFGKPGTPMFEQGMAQNKEILAAADKKVDDAISAYRRATKPGSPTAASLGNLDKALTTFRGYRDNAFFGTPLPAGLAPLPNGGAGVLQLNMGLNKAIDTLVAMEDQEIRTATQAAHRTYRQSQLLIAVALASGLLLALAVALVAARAIIRPLREVSGALVALGEGDLTRRVRVRGRDEVGQMAEAVNGAMASLRPMVAGLIEGADTLSSAAQDMSSTTTRLAEVAEGASQRAGQVSQAAEQVSENVQTVAAGSQELGTSITEIAHNATEATRVASQAVTVAEATTATVSTLGQSSTEIGNVVKVITSIAEQTNLLALNATIEAARAGESGKGFAVVASEVKDLAQETARATEDIERRVATIQGDTERAIAAIEEIAGIIQQINTYQITIASAVEEQSVTTESVNRNVNEAAQRTSVIARDISTVAAATHETAGGISTGQESASQLEALAQRMHGLAARFRY